MTGCASYQPAHLEYQTKPNFDQRCENSSASFDKASFKSSLATYSDPTKFFDSVLAEAESDKNAVDDIKKAALDAGRMLGEHEAEIIFWDETLEPVSGQLDVIYNYRSIMYENLVLPKRLIVVNGSTQKSDNILTFREYSFRVEGEFTPVDRTTSWREFFPIRPSSMPTLSVVSFDPSRTNLDTWTEGLNKGYQEGVCFAFLNYHQGLVNLHDDFTQRYLYIVASKRGVTKRPEVKSIKVAIQGNDNQVDLNSTTYKVEDKGNFKNSINWGGYD